MINPIALKRPVIAVLASVCIAAGWASGVGAQTAPGADKGPKAAEAAPPQKIGGSRAPSESATSEAQSLAEKATDPTSFLTQLQLQNSCNFYTHDSTGYGNQFVLQPVIPISKKKWFPFTQIIRPTLPLTTTADPRGSLKRRTGLGDLTVFDLAIFPQSWGKLAAGPVAIFPTATDDRTGQGKWQLGPGVAVIYTKIPKWLFGFLIENPISIGSTPEGRSRPPVSTLLVQPIVLRHFQKGWYASTGDLQPFYEWHSGNYNIPLSVKLGKVTKLFGQHINFFVQPFYTPHGFQSGGQPEVGVKFNATLLFPEIKL